MPHGFRVLLLAVTVLALGAQTATAQNAERRALDYIAANASRHTLSTADAAAVEVVSTAPGLRGRATHVYLTQRFSGIPVEPAKMTVSVMEDGRILSAMGRMVSGLALRAPSPTASLSPEAAVRALAAHKGLTPTSPLEIASQKSSSDLYLTGGGMSPYNIPVELVYAETERGDLVLAWSVSIYENGLLHDWAAYVDAVSGRVFGLRDRVVHEIEIPRTAAAPAPTAAAPATSAFVRPMLPAVGGASYKVFEVPTHSPYYTTPAFPADGRTVVSGAEDATASPFGWHDTDGAAGAEHTTTRGNNVFAYPDRDNNNSPDAGAVPDGGAGLTFDYPIDFTQAPSTYLSAATTNLFYWSNIIHDVFYQYGFDEASGNFQTNNYGRGGVTFDDAVYAEAQDAAQGNGNCNANFWTPNDDGTDDRNTDLGPRPRMQMYTCDRSNPDSDGDFDNDVVAHEYGHGISIRLTGGALENACLTNSEQMGEGWSDWFGLVMNIDADDAGTDRVPVGTYLLGQGLNGQGIRGAGFQPFPGAPYSTDQAINEAHYGHTRTSGLSQPHGIGFVWATILWEMTWDLIDEYGFDSDIYDADGTAGNQIALALVTEGLKIQPCSPGFVDGRDAILAADEALYGGIHTDLLWAAFARRGLGLLADQGSSGTNNDNQESFIEPEENAPAAVTDLTVAPDGDFVTLTFTATGDDGVNGTADSYDVRVSGAPITTDAEFDAATQLTVDAQPLEAGQTETVVAPGLDFETTYHFALKVSDESFNVSPLSNSAQGTTLAPPVANIPTGSIDAYLASGTATMTARLRNDGPSTMSYSLSLAEAPTTLARRTATAAKTAPEENALGTNTPTRDIKGSAGSAGVAQRAGSGGPDGFGYRWTDSNEPGGPTYAWEDISGTGTALGFSDDDSETLTLAQPFSFYGTDRSTVTVSSNGYLTFGSGSFTTTTNGIIPATATPNALIAPFWDDLNPADGGEVYYQTMADGRFIVQYQDIPPYSPGTPVGAATFQVILAPSGAIVYQYQEVTMTTTSSTVGIENDAGTDGLQVVRNAEYVEDGLAIRFAALFVDAAPSAGLVAPGGFADVALTFDASGLAEGVYNAQMTVTTNDPATPSVVVPLTMTIGSSAVANLSATEVDVDVVTEQTGEGIVTLSNPGAMDLTWSLDGTLPSWLGVDATSGTLAAGESQEIRLAMNAAGFSAGSNETASLTLTSNDPNNPSIGLAVTMNVVTAVAGEDEAVAGTHELGQPYPNPSGGVARVALRVSESQTVLAELYDTLGRRVATLHDGPMAGGERVTLELRDGSLAAGTYVLRVTGSTFADARRLTVSR